MARTRDEEVLERLKEHSVKLTEEQTEILRHDQRILILEKVVLLGEGERKPLVQVMRDLDTRLTGFIEAMEKKETEKTAEEKENRKWIRRTITTAVIGFFFAVILPSIWQIFLFWTRVYPILEKSLP